MEWHSDKPYSGKTKEKWDINDWADVYRYEWGINCVPSNGCQRFKGDEIPIKHRPPPYRKYYDEAISEEQHDSWKKNNSFDDGIMKLTGSIWHRTDLKNLKYCSIDCDNMLAIQEIIKDNPIMSAERHCIEMHVDNSTKCHWDFYIDSKDSLQKKSSDQAKYGDEFAKNTKPAFEVKTGEGLIFGTPSMHKGGSRYEYLNTYIPQKVNGDKVQKKINKIMTAYSLASKNKNTGISDMVEPESIILEGHNRQIGILKFIDSLRRRTHDLPLSDSFYINSAFWFAKNHTEEGYSDGVIMEKAKSAVTFINNSIEMENDEKYRKLQSGELVNGIYDDARWLIEFMVSSLKVISKIEIRSRLFQWRETVVVKSKEEKNKGDNMYNDIADVRSMRIIVDNMFNENDIFERMKALAVEYGKLGEHVYFDADQHIEIGLYITTKHHIKKLGLDGKLVYFDEKSYNFKTKEFIQRRVNELTTRIKNNTIQETIHYIDNSALILPESVFEKFRHLKICENGVYNIHTGMFDCLFSPDYLVMGSIPHRYDENASLGDSEKILLDILGDKEKYSIFDDFLSLCIYPDIGLYMMYVQFAAPGTGKKQTSVFIQNLLGMDNVTNFSIREIATDATCRIACARASLNIDEDMSDVGIEDISFILKWVTMDRITGRGIYSQPESMIPASRLMANTNVLFNITKESHMAALNDRTHTTILNTKFRHSEDEIPDIIKNTVNKENYDAYFTKILKNATILYKSQKIQGRNSPKQEYDIWNEFGNYIQKFCRKWLDIQIGEKTVSLDLWDKWGEYCVEKGIYHGSQDNFYRGIENIMHNKKKSIRLDSGKFKMGFDGFRILSDGQVGLNEQAKI